jgi:CRP-like cAMP-binding protein
MYVPKLEMNYIFSGQVQIQSFLFTKIKTVFMKPEEDVVTDGTEGDAFYIINKGTCTVFVSDENRVLQNVRQLKEGDHFGEIALIYN